MAKFIIEGGKKLKGRIKVSGNKNSILPCIAAALLTTEEVVLNNTPKILDVDVSLQILKEFGAQISQYGNTVKIKSSNIVKKPILSQDYATKLRASVLFVGPLLARIGSVEFYHPGGDIIGKRSIDTHLYVFKQLGYDFKKWDTHYRGITRDSDKDKEIFLDEASVTATENALMASVIGKRTVVLKNCAQEPHVVDLCNLLLKMGANIEGVGTNTLTIRGVERLGGAEFTVSGDYMEFGTYAVAAAITKGEIEIVKEYLPDLSPVIFHLARMGVEFEEKQDFIKISCKSIKAIEGKLHTNIWPGFPTDLMSVAIVLATQADGVSLMHDWMYESRMFFVDKLIAMGANIVIADPHRVLVCGGNHLYGRNMETPDIRAGMALVLAALCAEGRSVINRAEIIERGYEDIVGKLSSLGAQIERIDS